MALSPHSFAHDDPWIEPYHDVIERRVQYTSSVYDRLITKTNSLYDFANSHTFYGLHKTHDGWVFREWAPHATKLYIIGAFSGWNDKPEYALTRIGDTDSWEIQLPSEAFNHLDRYKLHIWWEGGNGYRIPSHARRVVQDSDTMQFDAQVWQPDVAYEWRADTFTPSSSPILIYETHIGMAGEEPRVHTYDELRRHVLPRIAAAGYTHIQLMAIAEHPYYGSFGYHVANFFAPSSRFGTPDELKQLIDDAHQAGIAVIMDLVHSHAVKNEYEGLGNFDGSSTLYFTENDHPAWDSRLFDYKKSEVLRFLLSNCRYWLDEFHFDGFRFDGVTSMLYRRHGLEQSFDHYDNYFDESFNIDASSYLTLANKLIHEHYPLAITIAEDMSGYPGVAAPVKRGGLGFDYRLSMGMPDLWIKLLKTKHDEEWSVSQLYHELTSYRPEEHTVSYAESHDQALVGDKTIMFRLADKAMYDHMQISDSTIEIDRAVALHKIIRFLTATLHNGGYLTFMGNEFGHPEWIDFPRKDNDWSYHYARRQWSLVDNEALKYCQLAAFNKSLMSVVPKLNDAPSYVTIHDDNHVLSYMRGDYICVTNLHPTTSFSDYQLAAPDGNYMILLSSDDVAYGGHGRIDTVMEYVSSNGYLHLYLPARTSLILHRFA